MHLPGDLGWNWSAAYFRKVFDIVGCCIPANHVGGDFFQYFEQDNKLSTCMAD